MRNSAKDKIRALLTLNTNDKFAEGVFFDPMGQLQNMQPVSDYSMHFKGALKTNGKKKPQSVYVKYLSPREIQAEVLYSRFINKAGGLSTVYYPFSESDNSYTHSQYLADGVVSVDIASMPGNTAVQGSKIQEKHKRLLKNKKSKDHLFNSFARTLEEQKMLEQIGLQNVLPEYQEMWLRNLTMLSTDCHNNNIFITHPVSNKKNCTLVNLDNSRTAISFPTRHGLHLNGYNKFYEKYHDTLDIISNPNTLYDRKAARETIEKLHSINMLDIAEDVYKNENFLLDSYFVETCEGAKNRVCEDLDRIL